MKYVVQVGAARYQVRVEGDRVWLDGVEHRAELRAFPASPRRQLALDGRTWPLAIEPTGPGNWIVAAEGERQEVEVLDERRAFARQIAGARVAHAGPAALKSPMPGLVVRVLVEPGHEVTGGTSLVVLEAMKMENELRAAGPGIVERVAVRPGQTVEKGELLVAFR